MDSKGRHLLMDFKSDKEFNNNEIKDIILNAINLTGATIKHIGEVEFTPHGYSLVVTVSESHASIHTFPENHAYFIDYFTCGSIDVSKFKKYIIEKFKPYSLNCTTKQRQIN
jgi:S-adenosylmethionine decarboxylase